MLKGIVAGAMVLTGVTVQPMTARAQIVTGNKLYQECTVDRGDATFYQSDAFCLGLVVGAVDEISALQGVNGIKDCIPVGATAEQLKDVTVKYMREHPADRNMGASMLITLAVMDAFGCDVPTKSK